MSVVPKKLVLWTGPRHSGKTTRALGLVKKVREAGFSVAGLLALSLYHNNKLIGFDAYDLHNESRKPLAGCDSEASTTRRFSFYAEGLRLGSNALSEASTKYSDLVIIDEFGPLELDGRIWRKAVDSLLLHSNSMILLVVREELTEEVHNLYSEIPYQKVAANKPESIDIIINILKANPNCDEL